MNDTMRTLHDKHGRIINYMRVSITDACNFRCCFCKPPATPGEGSFRDRKATREEFLRLCGIFASQGVDSFKITGGEPFMVPHALDTMAGLKALAGVRSVTVTTNGTTLERDAAGLAAIGLDGVNVSVNAMSQEKFERIAGAPFELRRLLNNIQYAKALGLRVKLNMVPIRGCNESDIVPLLEFALEQDISVRFIELMPLGQARHYSGMSFGEVRTIIEDRFGKATSASERLGNGPAVYLSLPGFSARVGYIAAVSQLFCGTCNRIRLNCAGFLRTCLHYDHGVDLLPLLRRGDADDGVAARIREAVMEKPARHRFGDCPDDMGREAMFRIGG